VFNGLVIISCFYRYATKKAEDSEVSWLSLLLGCVMFLILLIQLFFEDISSGYLKLGSSILAIIFGVYAIGHDFKGNSISIDWLQRTISYDDLHIILAFIISAIFSIYSDYKSNLEQELEIQVGALKDEKESLYQKNRNFSERSNNEKEKLKDSLSVVNSEIIAARAIGLNDSRKIKELNQQIETLNGRLRSNKDHLELLNKRIATLDTTLIIKSTNLESLQKRYKQQASDITKLTADLRAADSLKKVYQNDYSRIWQQFEKYKTRDTTLQQLSNKIEAALKSLSKDSIP
jgi:hypothetical protein